MLWCGAGGSPVLCVPSWVRLQTGPRKVLQEVEITSTGDKINIYQNILLYILYCVCLATSTTPSPNITPIHILPQYLRVPPLVPKEYYYLFPPQDIFCEEYTSLYFKDQVCPGDHERTLAIKSRGTPENQLP